ncbi:MAG: hypothetical protein WCQ67_01235 [Treponema sp.]
MKKPCLIAATVLILQAAVFLPCIISCSSHSESSSFISALDEIDNYISLDDTEEAVSLLNKISKKTFNSFSTLGVYKRFMTLGEKTLAEKSLIKGLKKQPNNLELTAVYTNFLIRENRIDEALEKSRSLSGTKYSSLYAESVLRACRNRQNDLESVFKKCKKYKAPKKSKPYEGNFFKSENFIQVYVDASNGTNQTEWLRNAACIYMESSRYNEAALLAPEKNSTSKDSLFWGYVFYDAGRYAESLKSLVQNSEENFKEINVDEIQALKADDYYILGEEQKSQEEREKFQTNTENILSQYELEVKNPTKTPDLNEKLAELIPIIYINSARYARLQNNTAEEYKILLRLVTAFPNNAPGLSAFGRFALETMLRPEEDSLNLLLRRAGLKTLSMEESDSVPKVNVKNAVERIDSALKNKKNPALVVLRLKLLNSIDTDSTAQEKIAAVWTLLEENEIGKNLYPDEIAQYAVEEFLSLDDDYDAKSLFEKYIQSSYGTEDKIFIASDNANKLSLWQCECAAWFCLVDGKNSDCQKLYEYIIEKYSGRSPSINSFGENESVVNAYINMASILNTYGNSSKALEYLNNASSRLTEINKKAEVLYRMAKINVEQGDKSRAVRSLKYCLSLKPSMYKAQLLLKKIK